MHAYPKEYFFAITNKGIGGLLRRWGEGASLLRGQWHPRDNTNNDNDEEDEEDEGANDAADDPDGDGEPVDKTSNEAAVDGLADDMSALGLVPSSVRFGRGGKAGLVTRSGRPAARHMGVSSAEGNVEEKKDATDAPAEEEGEDSDVDLTAVSDKEKDDEKDKPSSPAAATAVRGRRGRGRAAADGGGGGTGRGTGRGRGRGGGGFVPLPPRPPRGGFLMRGGGGRGLPRGLVANAMRARGRGALI